MRVRKLNESVNEKEIAEGIFNIGAAKKLNTILQDCDDLPSKTVYQIWRDLFKALHKDQAANDKVVGNIYYDELVKLFPEITDWAEKDIKDERPMDIIDYLGAPNTQDSSAQEDFIEDTFFGAIRDLGDYLEETKNNKLAAQILKEYSDVFKKFVKWRDSDWEEEYPFEESAPIKKIRENKKESSNKDKYLKEKWSIEKARELNVDIYDTIRTIIKEYLPRYDIADYINYFIQYTDMSDRDVEDTMFRVGGEFVKRLAFHGGNWSTSEFFRQKDNPNRNIIYGIQHFIKDTWGGRTSLADKDIDFLADFAVALAKKMTDAHIERAINSLPYVADTLFGDRIEEGFLSKKDVKGEENKLTDFLTANADKIKSLADCAPYILDDISDATINTAVAKNSDEMNTMIDIADACAKEFGYPNFETLRADDDIDVHFEAAKYLSKFVAAKKLGWVIKDVKDEIADCEKFNEELLKEDLGEEVGDYQEWVDYDMKKYGRISKETFDKLRKADLTAVKDEYGDYEVISKEKIHEACRKRKTDKKLEESIIYTSEGLNNAMKEFAKVVRDWKKTHVDSQEEKVIAESNWDDDSFNSFIATLEG